MNTTHDLEHLRTQWVDLLQSYGVEEAAVQRPFDDLVTHYTGPDRHYHTIWHIEHVLKIIDSLKSLANDLPTLKLAAWYHDVIYDTHSKDNEAQSAAYAEADLRTLGISAGIISRVKNMILATVHDTAAPGDVDCQILLDADLSSLGLDPLGFQVDGQAIRREYSWVPAERYRSNRIMVLKKFLGRERLYLTDQMNERFEAQAHNNIKRQIEFLKAGGDY